jgi:hypothetical protein
LEQSLRRYRYCYKFIRTYITITKYVKLTKYDENK